MTVTVIIYEITDTYDDGGWGGTTYQDDYFIHVLFDTVTKAISVQIRTSSVAEGGSLIASPATGPNLFFGHNGAATRVYPDNLSDLYAACDGTTLDYINVLANYPYGGYANIPDSPSCYIAPTCDLELSSLYTTSAASGPSTADGSFTVSATSSNGTIKYSLTPNFDYTSATNTTGVFTGLYPGDYTVYAKDPLGCQDSLIIRVNITTTYGVRWRLDYVDNVNKLPARLDIEERAYAGAVNEVCGGESPISIEYKADPNDPTISIVSASAIIQLLSETAGQFQDIFLGDDRQFRAKFYVGTGLPLYFMGFCVPEFYTEPYTALPFPIEITAVDGLGELSSTPFLDDNDNNYRGDLKCIQIIAEILKKAPLGLPIRSCFDIFETTMTTAASDDPLDQAYVDTRLFFNAKDGAQKCDAVLNKILRPGTRIFQSQGYWYILRNEKAVASSIPYRQFDEDGVYVSNGTISPEVDLEKPTASNRFAWRDKSQVLSFGRNYGYFEITHDLGRDQNLIDEGTFELTDLVEDGNGDLFFKNWNFLIGQTGITYGHEQVIGGTGAFFAKYASVTSNQNDSVLYTKAIPVKFNAGGMVAGDAFKLSFKAQAQVNNVFPWVRVGWQLKLTDLDTGDYFSFYPPAGERSDWEMNEDVINDLYLEKFNEFTSFETGLFRTPTSIANGELQLFIYFHNHYGRDFDDFNDLRAVDTVDFIGRDKRFYVDDPGEAISTKYYKLEKNSEAESEPDIIRPDDYNVLTNPNQWILKEDFYLGGATSIVSKFLFDDVKISFYPYMMVDGNMALVDPPENSIYSEEVSRFVKSDFEKTVYLGDAPEFNNAANIYKGYYKLSDGTPTNMWARAGVTEEKYINQILLEDLKAQMSSPPRRLAGSGISDIPVHYINYFKDYLDDRKYIYTNFTFDHKNFTYTVDLVEVLTGADGEPPPVGGQFNNQQFSSAFNIGA
jgi:hypothetical protein